LAAGRLRDFDQLSDYAFATWCRGEATRWGGDTVMPFAANVAVEIGGVCVVAGDYVYADASGAVVIPRASLHRVIDEALSIEAEDARSLEQIATEQPASGGVRERRLAWGASELEAAQVGAQRVVDLD
jgi:regulator of RNase E activity RraA